MKRICVFCGSSPGLKPEYVTAGRELGKTLAANKLTLVYGGGKVGVMGQLAKSCIEEGGEVIGVIPKQLYDREVAFTGLDKLQVVGSMHERKAAMAEMADGFIALPGGMGTIEEFFEIVTWAQLGFHCKPVGLLNICGFFDKMLDFLKYTVDQHFVDKVHYDMIQVDQDPEVLLEKFKQYRAPAGDKAAWVLEKTGRIEE